MRKYNLQLISIFAIFFLVLSTVMVFFYMSITQNFISDKAVENLSSFNIGISTQLESTINQTEIAYQDVVDELISDNADVVAELEAIDSYDLVALKSDLGYTINGTLYPYLTTYVMNSYYNQKVTIYPLNMIIDDYSDDTVYIAFEYQNYIVFIDALEYVETVLAPFTSIEHRFVIFHKDGYVFLDELNQISTDKLGDSMQDADQDRFFDDLGNLNVTHDVRQINIFDDNFFFAFNLMASLDSSDDIYFGQAVEYKTLIDTMDYLTKSLLFAFITIFILFLFGLAMLYRLLLLKNEDIESARLIHYYVKPHIVKTNGKGKIYFYNASFKRAFKNYKKYKHVNQFTLREGGENIKERVKKQEPFVCVFQTPQGEVYIRFIPVKYALTYALVGDDITKLEETYKYHREIAFYNPISNEPNMNYLKADLKVLSNDQKRMKHRNVLVIFGIYKYGDITKVIGERLSGEVLQYVSENVKKTLEKYHTRLYHISFDRFGILFENLTTYETVDEWADELIKVFEKPIDVDKNKFVLQFRIGQFNIDSDTYQNLDEDKIYDNTILALNRATAYHSQKPVVYDVTFGQSLSRRQVIETDMMSAIDRHEFVMYLQPQFSLLSEKIIGFEALVRWDNPKYKLDSPAEFIEIAENNNMIIDIGRIVMEETFRLAKILEPYNIKISMNISPVQILQAGFVAEIVSSFERHELKEHSISIEITETFLMTSFDMIIEKLKLLQARGFDIHLDDFGTGYSSLLYLKELPINAIKIDKDFTKYSNSDKHSRAIINMIISLAKNLDLSIIAEGVEDDKQYKFLQKAGCEVIQGFYIGKAMKLEDAIELIKAYNIDKSAPLLMKKRWHSERH